MITFVPLDEKKCVLPIKILKDNCPLKKTGFVEFPILQIKICL